MNGVVDIAIVVLGFVVIMVGWPWLVRLILRAPGALFAWYEDYIKRVVLGDQEKP